MSDLSPWLTSICKFAKKRDKTVSIAAFRGEGANLEVLVAQRKKDPFAGSWALPGGHVEKDETIEEAAFRELKEETALEPDVLSFVNRGIRYPGQGNERVDSIFACTVTTDDDAEASSDVAQVKWVKVNDLPKLVFNHDSSIIDAKKLLEGNPEKNGLLIAFEGLDGAGKSTQCEILANRLEEDGFPVLKTKWNSSSLLKEIIKEAKDERTLSPNLFCLLHAADMIHRYENDILPALYRNQIVVCDRYTHTSIARDESRGMPANLVEDIYKDVRQPSILFHCDIPVKEAVSRTQIEKGLGYYSSGMDLMLDDDKDKCCIKYQEILDRIYQRILPRSSGYHKLNMTNKKADISDNVWNTVGHELKSGWIQ